MCREAGRRGGSWRATFECMSNALSPRVRGMIINFDPSQPDFLSVAEFSRSVKISRMVASNSVVYGSAGDRVAVNMATVIA